MRKIRVIFDGPPNHDSGRFIEVETMDGKSYRVKAGWTELPHGYWSLGPFIDYEELELSHLALDEWIPGQKD